MSRAADHTIVVHGRATREAPADRMLWVAEVVERDANEHSAFDRCAHRARGLAEALTAAAGESAELTTRSISVKPRYDEVAGRQAGFEATTSVSVEGPVAKSGAVRQAALHNKADRLDGPTYLVDDLEPLRAEALAAAVTDGLGKAHKLARATGRALGHVVSVREIVQPEPERPGRSVSAEVELVVALGGAAS